jgi:hypothetical protein
MSLSHSEQTIGGRVPFGPETREAELYTQFQIGGKHFDFSAFGARGCSALSSEVDQARGTLQVNLECSLTWFETDHKVLGPIRIFQDPRITNKGWILARRDKDGQYVVPALSYFNQHLIFHIGDEYLYYPRAWQVVSAIDVWPPEFYQYHHLEDKTPVFDLITKKPNVAVKGISTISIKGKLDPAREADIRARCDAEIERFNKLPASKMSPENLTPAQAG